MMTGVMSGLKNLYHWCLRQAGHPKAPWVLSGWSFAESSFWPIPPDVLLIPMVMAKLEKAFWFAFICTVASTLGGVAGYAIGHYGFEYVGVPLIHFYHAAEKFTYLQEIYKEHGALIVAVAGFSPIPYKLFTITSGFVGMDLLSFFVVSLLSRGARFFLVAGLLWYGGKPFQAWIERNFTVLTIVGSVVLVGLVLVLKGVL